MEKPSLNMEEPRLRQFSGGMRIKSVSHSSPSKSFAYHQQNVLKIGEHYELPVLYRAKMVHLNVSGEDIEIVRTDLMANEVTISCSVNYVEWPELLDETLTIRFEETDIISKERANDILMEFESFMSPFNFSPSSITPLFDPRK